MPSASFQLAGADWVASISDDELIDRVGDASYGRALGYVAAERVMSLNTGDRGALVLSTVEGSRAQPYSTMLIRHREHPLVWTSRCSCPMTGDCKHVAATIITAREILGASTIAAPPSWHDFAERFLGGSEGREDGPVAGDLGLRVVAAPQLRPGRGRGSAYLLVPTRLSRTGIWNKSLAWDTIEREAVYSAGTRTPSTQLQAVNRLVGLWRSSHRQYAWGKPEVALDDLNAGVWPLIGSIIDAGVTLLPAVDRKSSEVTLRRDAATWRTTFRQLDDGAIEGKLIIDAPDAEAAQLLGDPAHGLLWERDDGDLVLQPLSRPLDEMAQWLRDSGPLRIEAGEATDFISRYGLRLQRRGLIAPTEAADAPDEAVQLHLTVSPEDEQGVRVSAAMRYPGGRLEEVDLDRVSFGRDRLAEHGVVDRAESILLDAGLLELIGGIGWWPRAESHFAGWRAVRFMQLLPDLEVHDDLVVVAEDGLPVFEEASGAPELAFGALESEQTDWLDLNITVTIDGEVVPFTPLFEAMTRGDEVFVSKVTGTYFRLDHPDLLKLRQLIDEAKQLTDRSDGGVRLSRFHVGLWDELVELGVVDEQVSEWSRRVQALRDLTAIEPPQLPVGLKAELRPYQQDGFTWLSTLWDLGLGGVLADDMGLGKTVQTLALIARAHERGELDAAPVLVVVPSSVVGVWQREAATFTPDLNVVAVPRTTATRGATLAQVSEGAHIVVTSYTVLRLEADEFEDQPWRALVLDEAHTVKNHQSKTFQSAKRVGAPFTLAVTGTPLENSLMDLWSMFALAAPALYPKPDEFTRTYRKPIEAGHAPELLDRLRRRIRPLMLRRTKELVASDLPPKQIQVKRVTLTTRHSQNYNRLLQRERQRLLGLLDDPDGNRVAILASLTRLRRAALDPRLVDDNYPAHEVSAKLSFLVEQMGEIVREGHRALVFSSFTGYLRMAEAALKAAGHDTSYLDGSMSTTSRAAAIAGFKDGDQDAFLISLKAGGVGLTLTEADYVFVLDPWWNPAAEAQAIDRTHRIGQENPVMVYRLISEDTIEDKVLALQERKRELFSSVMDDGGAIDTAITAEDIRGLIE